MLPEHRLAPALPDDSKQQLDTIDRLCLDNARDVWGELACLQIASRHFVAVVYSSGKLSHYHFHPQWAAEQRKLRMALRAFLTALHDFVLKLRYGDRAQLAKLRPQALLGAPFDVLEALHPEVIAQSSARQGRLARWVRSPHALLPTSRFF